MALMAFRRSLCALTNTLWVFVLAGCVGGPVSNSTLEGALCCRKPIAKDETVVLKGNSCLAKFLTDKSKSIKVLTDGDVKPIFFPAIPDIESINNDNKSIDFLNILRERITVDAIKEYNIRYLIYTHVSTHEEPMPMGWSSEDFKSAIYSGREKRTRISMLIIDAKDAEIVGSIHQNSEGRIRVVPLLLIFSRPDTEASACQEFAEVVSKLLSGQCDGMAFSKECCLEQVKPSP